VTAVMASGTVNLTALVKAGGTPYKGSPYLFWSVYPLGADGKPAKRHLVKDDGNPNRFVLAPGRYVARAEAGVVRAEAGFTIKAAGAAEATTVLNAGRIKVAFVDAAGGKPVGGTGVWHIYATDADGKPADRYLTYADRNPYGFFLPEGRYLARAKVGGKQTEGTFQVAPGDNKAIEFVVGKP